MSAADRSLTPGPMPATAPGRAATIEEKRACIEVLLDAWINARHLRLGQLLIVATHGQDLFYVEDDDLAAASAVLSRKITR